MTMAKFSMNVYDSTFDITMIFCWVNEDEYHLAETFLTEIGARRSPPSDRVNAEADFYLQDRQQFEAFRDFSDTLKKRRPRRSDPPTLAMNVYDGTTGVQMTMTWANEEEYQQVRAFLIDVGAMAFASNDDRQDQPEFFCVKAREQLDALFEFSRSIRNKGK